MKSFLTTLDYSGLAPIELDLDLGASNLDDTSRRISRVATLDGGVVVTDFGFADGDRTITLATPAAVETRVALQTMQRSHGLIGVSLPDGYYSAGFESISLRGGLQLIGLLLRERLSA